MKPFFYISLSLLCLNALCLGLAQDMSATEIISAMEAEIDAIQDVEARLQGRLSDLGDLDLKIDIFAQLIPEAQIARAEFFEPFELADNFILLNEDAVYNYLFLTNQVTILDANDPDAFGSIFPDIAENDEVMNYDLSLERLFTGWDAKVLDYGQTEVDGNVENIYQVRLDSPEASDFYIIFSVVDKIWQPHNVQIFKVVDDSPVLELTFRDFQRDIGLDADDVAYIPSDAEIIDER